MAADIENEFGVKSELVPGKGGVYKITADDKVLYSKKASGDQFPEQGRVIDEIRAFQDA